MTMQDLTSTVDKHEHYAAWAALHERRADKLATALHGADDFRAATVAAQQYAYHSGYADALRAVARDAVAGEDKTLRDDDGGYSIFTCSRCGKVIHLQPQVRKAYAGQTLCLDCRAAKLLD